jgi:4-hydroxy-2-oxoheptanedioate aldolase
MMSNGESTGNQRHDWLQSKEHLIGPFVRIPRAEIIEILALAGFDFAVVDLEHGPIGVNEVYPMILAAERHGLKLIARLPALQESYFKWLLDLGIGGLQVPHIKSASDAELAVKFSRFSPSGERGLCRFVRAAEFSNLGKEEYLRNENSKRLLILQIEGSEGVEHIEEIAAVPGVDVIFVGPYDLSQSLGLIGQIWHEKVIEQIEKVVSVCKNHGVAAGVFTDTPEGVKRWSSLGIKYINYRIEVEFFLTSLKNHLRELKEK